MSQYNNHWRLTNHKVACWCIMQIFKCGICALADGCISMSYLNILVSLRVCVNLQSHSCEQAWCCIKFSSSVYRDEQCSFSFLMAMFTQKCHMCAVSVAPVDIFGCFWLLASCHILKTPWRSRLTVALSSTNLSQSLAVCLSLAHSFSSMPSRRLMGLSVCVV